MYAPLAQLVNRGDPSLMVRTRADAPDIPAALRAIVRDVYERNRVGGMISLVIAVMMIAQMLSPLVGGVLNDLFGWRSIFYVLAGVTTLTVVAIMLALPETRRRGRSRGQKAVRRRARSFLANPRRRKPRGCHASPAAKWSPRSRSMRGRCTIRPKSRPRWSTAD